MYDPLDCELVAARARARDLCRVERRDSHERETGCRIVLKQLYQSVRVGVGQRPQQDGVHDTNEYRYIRATLAWPRLGFGGWVDLAAPRRAVKICARYILDMRTIAVAALCIVTAAAGPVAQSAPHEQRAREIYKELVEINTTDTPAGSVTKAAEAMAARLKAAGFPDADIRLLGPAPNKFNLVARYRGTGEKRPLLLLAHLDVVDAKREDWSSDPFVLPRGRRLVLRTRDQRRQGDGVTVRRQSDSLERRGVQAGPGSDSGPHRRRGRRHLQRRLVAGQRAPRSGRRGVRDQRGRRRQHAKGEIPDERGAGEREGLSGLPSGGDQLRRSQLAAGEGQRHLSPLAGPRPPCDARIPGPVERDHARLFRAFRRGRNGSRHRRRHASRRASNAGPGRCRSAVSQTAVLEFDDADDVRGHAARGWTRQQRPAAARDRQRQLPDPAGRESGGGQTDHHRHAGRSENLRVAWSATRIRASRRFYGPT